MFFPQSRKLLLIPMENTGKIILYILILGVLKSRRDNKFPDWMTYFLNLFFTYLRQEPHFYLSVFFPDLCVRAAATEINHEYPSVGPQSFQNSGEKESL
jgi:hypothetical protein